LSLNLEPIMYRRILAPIDSSAAADLGFQKACDLAAQDGASLVIVHVVEDLLFIMEPAAGPAWAEVSEHMRRDGRALLEKAHLTATKRRIASEIHLEERPGRRVSDVLAACCAEHHCDLVVIGSHGRRGVDRLLLGSDAERLVRVCKASVLVVRGEPHSDDED
jgi:nucleotide-binding universal stress UspA family protein